MFTIQIGKTRKQLESKQIGECLITMEYYKDIKN